MAAEARWNLFYEIERKQIFFPDADFRYVWDKVNQLYERLTNVLGTHVRDVMVLDDLNEEEQKMRNGPLRGSLVHRALIDETEMLDGIYGNATEVIRQILIPPGLRNEDFAQSDWMRDFGKEILRAYFRDRFPRPAPPQIPVPQLPPLVDVNLPRLPPLSSDLPRF